MLTYVDTPFVDCARSCDMQCREIGIKCIFSTTPDSKRVFFMSSQSGTFTIWLPCDVVLHLNVQSVRQVLLVDTRHVRLSCRAASTQGTLECSSRSYAYMSVHGGIP